MTVRLDVAGRIPVGSTVTNITTVGFTITTDSYLEVMDWDDWKCFKRGIYAKTARLIDDKLHPNQWGKETIAKVVKERLQTLKY